MPPYTVPNALTEIRVPLTADDLTTLIERTDGELRTKLVVFRQWLEDRQHTTPCRRCNRACFEDIDGSWQHVGADGSAVRGCYAASYDGTGWDRSINRTWTAAV